MGFGLLIVLSAALGYTLQGLPTALLGTPALHRLLGFALVALAFLMGAYLLVKRQVPRMTRVLLGLYDLNALLGLVYLALAGRLSPHPSSPSSGSLSFTSS